MKNININFIIKLKNIFNVFLMKYIIVKDNKELMFKSNIGYVIND